MKKSSLSPFILFSLIKIILLCIIAFTPLSINASDRPEVIFDEYLEHSGVNIDKFADAIIINEVDIKNENTIRFLETFSKYDLQLLINTIYAKHGVIFKTNKIQMYFKNKSWYIPKSKSVVLTDKEEYIISVIKKIINLDNVKFTEFSKLFTPIDLPFSYSDRIKLNRIDRIYIRKYINDENYYWLKFYAIGKLHQNSKFMVLLYNIETIETQPCIAVFTLDGNLISNKSFFSIGGDITHYTNGTLSVEKDLTINVEIEELKGNIVRNTKREKYLIDSNGLIKKIK